MGVTHLICETGLVLSKFRIESVRGLALVFQAFLCCSDILGFMRFLCGYNSVDPFFIEALCSKIRSKGSSLN